MRIDLIFQKLADKWHNEVQKQVRKYTNEPYTAHTNAVAAAYLEFQPDDFIGAAIAHGHDLLEDTPVSMIDLESEAIALGGHLAEIDAVIDGIVDLTDVFTHKMHPNINREKRKQLEAQRLGQIPERSQNIKVLDLVDNTVSIVAHDTSFARVYLMEKARVLSHLRLADWGLLARAFHAIGNGLTELQLHERKEQNKS